MSTTLDELSVEQMERLIERAVDRRLQVWLDQVLDALSALGEKETADLRPEFAESLRRSIAQAQRGEGANLHTFCEQVGQCRYYASVFW